MKKFIYSLMLFSVIASCKKENNTTTTNYVNTGSPPAVYTTKPSAVTSNSIKIGGNVLSDSAHPIMSRGICWNKSGSPLISDSSTLEGIGNGTFESTIIGLSAGTTYYFRAYAKNVIGTTYGNEIIQATSASLTIGELYNGGKVAYILQAGDPGYIAGEIHGFVVGTNTLGSAPWYNGSYVTTGATGTALGTGNANTNAIVAIQGNGYYAAKLCYDLVYGGYSDWYLPSKDELYKIFINQSAIGIYNFHWSSSEI